jgi:hypothetical protein
MVEGGMGGDFRNPVFKGRAPVKLRQGAPGFQKCFLRQILDPVRIALVTGQNGEDPRLMTLDDDGEIIGGAVANLLQEPGIFVHESIAQF